MKRKDKNLSSIRHPDEWIVFPLPVREEDEPRGALESDDYMT
jgi:hypothetical protein